MNLSDSQPPTAPASGPAPLGPDSLVWQMGFPRTGLLVAGRALVLQTAHPVVGAGVRDFSDFTRDPWGRLDRTLRSLQVQLFGGPAARQGGRTPAPAPPHHPGHRLRRGALQRAGPRHLRLGPSVQLRHHPGRHALVRPVVHPRRARAALRRVASGRARTRCPPRSHATRPGRLPCLRARHGVDHAGRQPDGAHRSGQPGAEGGRAAAGAILPGARLWRALRPLGGSFLHDVTVGTLPAALRQRLGLHWTMADRRRLQAAVVLMRAGTAPLPDRLVHYPMGAQARRAARRLAARGAA